MDGVANSPLVAHGATLDVVCHVESDKAAVGLQTRCVERALDGDLESFRDDILLAELSHGRIAGALGGGAQK